MLERQLLSNNDWHVGVNWLGLGSVRITNISRGITIRANNSEKRVLLLMLEKETSICKSEDEKRKVMIEIFEGFATAVFSAASMGVTSANYRAFFADYL